MCFVMNLNMTMMMMMMICYCLVEEMHIHGILDINIDRYRMLLLVGGIGVLGVFG